jgi:hypothetical protein
VSPAAKPAAVRFYVDVDVLYKRKRPPCPVRSSEVPDHIWIPEVTRRGWLIVTRDSAIPDHRAEIAAVRDSGARLVALAGSEAIGHLRGHPNAPSRRRPVMTEPVHVAS